ncbi:hypothetical protein BKA67DRAFT_522123 [Truncatella angustata]|uniref:Uncharacterized protein n=1 Tax=Truncatella angustata TaxID=152316 RepID=A0A9P8UEA0_9PEZI|nr:uncharacterized protein BKA67DRAFT_522123 [Truncatella angustata]KAH6648326.1 hypothetical protein BKA67DRAFT_522123 [Truncatella angustata]KAH8201651.1 hypothetical protein TruAng_004172 [Truncatella angustata]
MRSLASLFAACGLISQVLSQTSSNSTTGSGVSVRWLEGTPSSNLGTTFGLPWARGEYPADTTTFTGATADGDAVQLQSWITAYWPDNSIKWTGHAIAATDSVADEYVISPSSTGSNSTNGTYPKSSKLRRQLTSLATESDSDIVVNTGKITAVFQKSGSALISSIKTSSGKVIGQNGVLVLQSQTSIVEDDEAGSQPERLLFQSEIEEATVSEDSSARALVTVKGKHQLVSGGQHDPWLQFTLRFYLYANSDAIKLVHTIIFDGDQETDFITGLGIRFDVPLSDEQYNRHVRIAGVEGGFLNEAVQGITGLRRDPGAAVRAAQVAGQELPDESTWDTRVTTRTQWIPTWGDYSLSQLSPDGFTLKKRTKAGYTWVNIPGGNRSEGLAYLGGATGGGLAVGLRDFWKRYPTGLDIRNAANDIGQVTVWLYSPSAGPMDNRAFHDGMGEDTYAKQLDALEITYEDWESGYDTPYGVARTAEIFLFAFDATPSSDTLVDLTAYTNAPPLLVAEPAYLKESEAIGTYWDLPDNTTTAAATIEKHLDFLIQFYRNQVEQRRWYGFWDFGDFMHTYDSSRHQWRYDVGGYAWDNSELSPDLFFWNQFLRTGRPDVFRFAEAQVRHSSEVDIYHIGNFSGLGTRHGVLHWGDSAKQIRISTTIYRRVFYYISGGDERIGDVIHGVLDAEQAFYLVDARRKVRSANVTYVPDKEALYINIGLDWFGLAGAWLHEWERRGPRWEEARSKLFKGFETIVSLKNGLVTGEAYYNSTDGAFSPPPTDLENEGIVVVSHLDGVFGLQEIFTQIIDHVQDDLPDGILDAYLDYAYYYGAGSVEQTAKYGSSFGSLSLYQGHSRLTAYVAWKTQNETLAARAWKEFDKDGLISTNPWSTTRVANSSVLAPVDDGGDWISTNSVALYGLAAIENLRYIKDYLK